MAYAPWQWWTAETIARATGCPVDNVREHWPLIAASLERRGLWERDIARGVLATVAIETDSTFLPLHEYGTPADWARYSGGPAYAGRGYAQITHDYGYRAAGQALGLDLLRDPNLAMQPQIAADILAWFFASKTIPSKDGKRSWTLAQLCRERDWYWLRVGVQGGTAGLERLQQIVSALGDGMAQLRVTEDGVRLRERPDLQAPILYEARAGELVTPLSDHAWRQVRAGDRTGWMAAKYLSSDSGASNEKPKEEAPPSRLHFDPSTPTELQRQDFSCSIRSATWVLKSLHVDIDAGTLEDEMVPSIVSRDLGLLDARGYGLAETFKRHLDPQWHGRIRVYESLTWDDMQWRATGGPMALGGRGWNHWTAVRGINPDGSLNLANPAPGWKGIDQRLTRADWDRLGPWSGVLVDATPAP